MFKKVSEEVFCDAFKKLSGEIYNLQEDVKELKAEVKERLLKERIKFLKGKYNIEIKIDYYMQGQYGLLIYDHNARGEDVYRTFAVYFNENKIKCHLTREEAIEIILSDEIENDIKIYLYDKKKEGKDGKISKKIKKTRR